MTEYIFLPVPTAEMQDLAQSMLDARHGSPLPVPALLRNYFAEGAGKGIVRWLGKGCLRGVGGNDKLYLLLHGTGTPGSRVVGANRNHGIAGAAKRYKHYTPVEIAELLEAEGLTKSFGDLVLLCCGAGLEGGDDPAYAKSFGERVYDAMLVAGYPNITVTAYQGNVKPGAGHDFVVDRIMPGTDGRGREIVDKAQAQVVYN